MNVSALSLAVIFSLTLLVISSPAFAQVPDTAILGDFRCYVADPNDPLTTPFEIIDLQDQFDFYDDVEVFDRRDFCVNVQKNLNAITPDIPNQHFLTYDLVTIPPAEEGDPILVQVEDQFMSTTFSIGIEPTELWAPAEKNHDGIIFPKLTDIHYACYDIGGSPINEEVLLFDQFNPQGPAFNVLDPVQLCNPVIKILGDGDETFGEINEEHLICYNIKPVDIEEDVNISAVIATTQFNEPDGESITSQDVQFNRLCVIASKTPIIVDEFCDIFPDDPSCRAVGGELLPIDSTALLLAGAQTFSWMIPVVLSALGIGLFVIRKSENSG